MAIEIANAIPLKPKLVIKQGDVIRKTKRLIILPIVCLKIRLFKNKKCRVQNVKKYERNPTSRISIGIYESENSLPAINSINVSPKK